MHDDDTIEDGDRFVPPCGHRNAPNARFCDVCGAELPRPCPRCGTLNRRRANFCNHCGSGLRDARPQAAPSIVVKPITANGLPVVKLSDNVEKVTGDPAEVDRIKRILGK